MVGDIKCCFFLRVSLHLFGRVSLKPCGECLPIRLCWRSAARNWRSRCLGEINLTLKHPPNRKMRWLNPSWLKKTLTKENWMPMTSSTTHFFGQIKISPTETIDYNLQWNLRQNAPPKIQDKCKNLTWIVKIERIRVKCTRIVKSISLLLPLLWPFLGFYPFHQIFANRGREQWNKTSKTSNFRAHQSRFNGVSWFP